MKRARMVLFFAAAIAGFGILLAGFGHRKTLPEVIDPQSAKARENALPRLERLKSGYYVIPVTIGGREFRMLLDSGSSGTFLDMKARHLTNLTWQPCQDRSETAVKSFALTTEYSLLPGFSLLGIPIQTSCIVYAIDLDHINSQLKLSHDLPVEGVLGTDFMEKSHLVVDFANARCWMSSSQQLLPARDLDSKASTLTQPRSTVTSTSDASPSPK